MIVVDPSAVDEDGPLSWYMYEPVLRERLLLAFPGHARAIEDADAECEYSDDGTVKSERVWVVRAWRRRYGDSVGRHAIIAKDLVLHDQEWKSDTVPIVTMRYEKPLDGWHGGSLIGVIDGVQRDINRLLWKARANHEAFGNSFAWITPESGLTEADFGTSEWLKVLQCVQPPQIVTPDAIPPQTLELLERTWMRGFEISGLNQLAASAAKPPGLNSGRALQEYHDLQTVRFSEHAYDFQDAWQGLGQRFVALGKELDESDGWEVEDLSNGMAEKINWASVKLKDFRIEMQVASQLPNTPSARTDMLADWMQKGLVDRTEARALMRITDMDDHENLTTARTRNIKRIMEAMLRDGQYRQPSRYQDLELGLRVAEDYYSKGQVDGVSQDRLAVLELWMEEASMILSPPRPTAAPPPGAMPADPEAALQLAKAQAMQAQAGGLAAQPIQPPAAELSPQPV
jgi:hypothetical protein